MESFELNGVSYVREEEAHKELAELAHNHKLAGAEVESANKIALKEMEFTLKHAKDEAVAKAEDDARDYKEQLAVATKEIEMLTRIVDINGDIIDVKTLVKDLIAKLPTVNFSGTPTLSQPGGGKDQKQNTNQGGGEKKQQ